MEEKHPAVHHEVTHEAEADESFAVPQDDPRREAGIPTTGGATTGRTGLNASEVPSPTGAASDGEKV